MTTLQILHFNDVYRVTPQKLSPKSNETIDVTQFGALVDDLRSQWPEQPDGTRDGLVLFSGDLFSPSVESSVTRGSHMVPVMNEIGPDVALTGNHDFDFGYPHLSKLIQDTKFPWILSNIIDTETSKVPEHIQEFQVFERGGSRIGIIGLVEQDWITTVASWPRNFKYRDMVETGLDLSNRLRDPEGKYRCDLIIALTHSRVPNDIQLAKDLHALSPAGQEKRDIALAHGVDLLLGGHDHLYFVGKGAAEWQGYDLNADVLGGEKDHGDVLVVKSGTDFRDLSEIQLECVDTPLGSVRRKVISRMSGKWHTTKPGSKSSPTLQKLLEKLLSSVSETLKAPVCTTTTVLDCRSGYIRVDESAAGNWFADMLRCAYDDALCMKGCGGSDGVFICAGTLRGDSTYGPGVLTLGNILEILPFEDPIVVQELDGATIWNALEGSLSKWPAQEGRFPCISGIRVTWDSRREPGSRVLGVWLTKEKPSTDDLAEKSAESLQEGLSQSQEEPIENSASGRKYKIVTREYMSEGHDGFEALAGKPYLIDGEGGHLMSALVRKYLLGAMFVKKMASVANQKDSFLHSRTREAVAREQASAGAKAKAASRWQHATDLIIRETRAKYREKFSVSRTEHMSIVDPYDGASIRKGQETQPNPNAYLEECLLVVSPRIDGRLNNVGKKE